MWPSLAFLSVFSLKYFAISCQEHQRWLLHILLSCSVCFLFVLMDTFIFEFYCLEVVLIQYLLVSIFMVCFFLSNLFFVSFCIFFSEVFTHPRISDFVEEFNLEFLLMCLNLFLWCCSSFVSRMVPVHLFFN